MKCSFCSEEIEKGTGIMYVRKSGQAKYYCSHRCYKFDVVHRMKNKHQAVVQKAGQPVSAPAQKK